MATKASEAAKAANAVFNAKYRTRIEKTAGAKARRLKVLRMKKAGCSRRVIAHEIGVSLCRVHQLIAKSRLLGECAE